MAKNILRKLFFAIDTQKIKSYNFKACSKAVNAAVAELADAHV